MLPNLSLSAGGGGPSGSSSNAGISTPITTPFNFDGSGWIVNFGNGNSSDATGNRDANRTTPTSGIGGLSGMLGGISPNMIVLAAVAYLLLRKK
jgi:hypothetical protein